MLTKGKFLVSFEVSGHTKEYTEGFTEEEHDEIIDYYINFLEKPETLYTFTEKIISLLKSFIK